MDAIKALLEQQLGLSPTGAEGLITIVIGGLILSVIGFIGIIFRKAVCSGFRYTNGLVKRTGTTVANMFKAGLQWVKALSALPKMAERICESEKHIDQLWDVIVMYEAKFAEIEETHKLDLSGHKKRIRRE